MFNVFTFKMWLGKTEVELINYVMHKWFNIVFYSFDKLVIYFRGFQTGVQKNVKKEEYKEQRNIKILDMTKFYNIEYNRNFIILVTSANIIKNSLN